MTLTPDAPKPEDNENQPSLKKDDGTTTPPHGYEAYGTPTGAHPVPPAPPSPYASPYSTPSSGYGTPPAPPAPNSSYGTPQGMYQNPSGSVPQHDMLTDAKKPENLSIIYGASSIACSLLFFVIGFTIFLAPVFGILGLGQAKKAKNLGLNSTTGAALSWVGIGISIAIILVMLLFIGVLAAAFGGLGSY